MINVQEHLQGLPRSTRVRTVALAFPPILTTSGSAITADRLAQLVEQRTAVREVAGSNLGRTNTQGL